MSAWRLAAAVAALAACSLLAGWGTAAPAHAGTGIGGAAQCNDNFDNDLDLKVDFDGGPSILGPLGPDPDCTGPADDSESATCPLCTNFVTTFDPDGPGGLPAKTRTHKDVIANVPTSIDVNGNLPPLASGLPVPGYEMRVTVQGFSATSPTIRIEKLASAPANLPLRIEIYVGDVDRTSFGYDTLDSTAPQSFVAALNLNDRDGSPATSQALVNMTIGGPGRRLTVVNEQFRGEPDGTRTARHIRRLTFSGDPARGTVVPTSAGLDLTSSEHDQHVILTHNLRTTFDFKLDEPGAGTDASGHVDELPQTADVGIGDVDVNGDGKLDTAIDYAASSVAHTATVHIDGAGKHTTPDGATVDTRVLTDAAITDLPTEAHLTFATPPPSTAPDPPNRTEVTYHADTRATHADVHTDDGFSQFGASLDNLPESIDELTFNGLKDSGDLNYHADEIVDHAHVETHGGQSNFSADVDELPANVVLSYETPKDLTRLEYDGDSIVPRAAIHTDGVIHEPPPQPGHDPIPDHRRVLDVVADGQGLEGQGLARHLEFTLDNADHTVEYIASDVIPEIHVTGTDEQPFFERARVIDLLIHDLPLLLSGSFVSDFVELDPHGGQVGSIDLSAHSPGIPESLPSTEDGVLMRDTADKYLLAARVRGLKYARYVNHGGSTITVNFDAAPPTGTDARVDVIKDVHEQVWVNQPDAPTPDRVSRDGTTTLNALVRDYPADVTLETSSSTNTQFIDYTAASAAGRFDFSNETRYRGDPVPVTYKQQYTADRLPASYVPQAFTKTMHASLNPMPAEFHVCQDAVTDQCSGDTWQSSMFEDFNPHSSHNGGSVSFTASPRTTFDLQQFDGGEAVPISYIRDAAEVDDAGDECEQPILNIWCAYADQKPGTSTKDIHMVLGHFNIQSHQESSGWVGHNIADIFASGDNQGYVAIDTGWDADQDQIDQDELCFKLGFEDPSPCNPDNCTFCAGYFIPRADDSISGSLAKGGNFCMPSDDCQALEDSFPLGFGGKIDAVDLNFGNQFAADHRVFEFDPDELIFAIHQSGIGYCDGTNLNAAGTDITGYFCPSYPDVVFLPREDE